LQHLASHDHFIFDRLDVIDHFFFPQTAPTSVLPRVAGRRREGVTIVSSA
jgi:hypothetical protein